jgi:hypothetical protein
MDENKILYAISVEDVMNVSVEADIPFDEEDLLFIEEKIGDYMGSKWSEAIEYALQELERGK